MAGRKVTPEQRAHYREQIDYQLDYGNAPILSVAWEWFFDYVEEHRWDSWVELRQFTHERAGVAVQTADDMIRKAVKAGYLDIRGRYVKKKHQDNREVRAVEWPEAWR